MRGARLPKERIIIPERVAARAATRFIVDENGCHVSKYQTRTRGYAYIKWTGAGGKQHAARVHRAAWESVNGPIPDGMIVDHLCHNTLCVRVGHLRLATPAQSRENLSGPSRSSQSGVRGVYFERRSGGPDRWVAQVKTGGKKHRRRFDSMPDADRWARAMRAKLHDPIPPPQ